MKKVRKSISEKSIRESWLEAKKEGKLFGGGIYPIPMYVAEQFETKRIRCLELAGVPLGKDDFIYHLKKTIVLLEAKLEAKEKQIDTLLDKMAKPTEISNSLTKT